MNTIYHDVTGHCFELRLDSHRCVLDYTLNNNVMTITHTGVPNELSGRGLAAEITKFALDYAQSQGWRVIPQCSYVAAYIKKHPQYTPLMA
jgi:predicted GNAT family acetyltransferase